MLHTARQILLSELVLAEDSGYEEVERRVEQAMLHCEISRLKDQMRDRQGALESIERALELDRENDRYHWLRANTLRRAESYEKALEAYEDYERRHPDNDFANLYYNMANACGSWERTRRPSSSMSGVWRSIRPTPAPTAVWPGSTAARWSGAIP